MQPSQCLLKAWCRSTDLFISRDFVPLPLQVAYNESRQLLIDERSLSHENILLTVPAASLCLTTIDRSGSGVDLGVKPSSSVFIGSSLYGDPAGDACYECLREFRVV